MRLVVLVVCCCLLAGRLVADVAEPVTLEQIMADPDWIGSPPESAYWSDDSSRVYFEQKRAGESIRDIFLVDVDSGLIKPVDIGEVPESGNATRVYAADRRATAWIDNGDVFFRELPSGAVRRLTGTVRAERRPMFVRGDTAIAYLQEGRYIVHDLLTGSVTQLLDLKFEDDPEKPESFDTLRGNQQRVYTTIVEDARRDEARKAHDKEHQRARPSAAPLPLYLGKGLDEVGRWLSPDARRLILVTKPSKAKPGKAGVMPNYMTESGYTETTPLRSRVGRNGPPPHTVWLIDIEAQSATELDLSGLPDVDEDPLKRLRESALKWHTKHGADEDEVKKLLEAPDVRSVEVEDVQWNSDGSQVAIQLHAVDNKDRWIVTLASNEAALITQHRLSDTAWINYHHNEFGWLPDNRTLWYLSEESGYSHLYTKRIGKRRATPLTSGNYVVSDPVLSGDGSFLTFRSNQTHPGTYEISRVPVGGGEIEALTAMGGVNEFRLSPDDKRLLVIHSEFDRHPDLYSAAIGEPAAPVRLTDTVSAAFQSIDWVKPKIVEIPSTHVDRNIFSKLYLPADYDPEKKGHPAVMFVHGAGYTQNAHAGWPYYFREFMFHTLLTQHGVIVIDMDYRASKGYGRDWRTAIYRQMGHPELEDFQDGVAWLVENYSVDPERVGVYGGSYGGFMTFMAMFLDPDLFAAGAALRPVVDWAHYNHGYTSNILNTPLIDPVAYEKSSPIHHAAGLKHPILIASGMQDDNVFFQDSVLMVQRLIELQKQDFEIALYPLDGHGFTHADSWLDEYRRVFKLMRQHVINEP